MMGLTIPQLIFWTICLGGTLLCTVLFYPGVKRNAYSKRDSWLASFMAAALMSTFMALIVSFFANVIDKLVS